jgi:hypothetical protein
MKKTLRSMMENSCPDVLNAIVSVRRRRMFRQRFSSLHEEVRQRLYPNGAEVAVRSGPFQGMRYLDEIVWGSVTPRWLGCYEWELHGAVRQILDRGYKTIIDVGCAEGYYAVGLALRIPSAKVFAFDTDFISRGQLSRLARLNHVERRVKPGSYCSHADLDAIAAPGSLVVCDIEGFEQQLLDPVSAASLLRSDILVEVHDAGAGLATIEQTLYSRFRGTHVIERIVAEQRSRWVEENGPKAGLPRDLLIAACDEGRNDGQVWLWMQTGREASLTA